MTYKFRGQRSSFGNIFVVMWNVHRSATNTYFSVYGVCGCDLLCRSMPWMHNWPLWKVSTIELVNYVPVLAYKALIEGNKRERLMFLGRIRYLWLLRCVTKPATRRHSRRRFVVSIVKHEMTQHRSALCYSRSMPRLALRRPSTQLPATAAWQQNRKR
jgi:hypothetical protein